MSWVLGLFFVATLVWVVAVELAFPRRRSSTSAWRRQQDAFRKVSRRR